MFVYCFVDPDLREDSRKWGIDFEIVEIGTSAHWY